MSHWHIITAAHRQGNVNMCVDDLKAMQAQEALLIVCLNQSVPSCQFGKPGCPRP